MRMFFWQGALVATAPKPVTKSFVESIQIRPEEVASFMAKLDENAKAARKERGCRLFHVLVDPQDETKVTLYEVYDDGEASEVHEQGAAIKKYVAEDVPLAKRERRFWKRI